MTRRIASTVACAFAFAFAISIASAPDAIAHDESLAPLVDKLRPAVVNIQALHAGGGDDGRSLGSGMIVDPSGLVLTNNHVVDGATVVRVVLSTRRTVRARVVGRDPLTDLALLRIPGGKTLPTVTFGDSDAIRVGDPVFTIGNPFGLGTTVTSGILSATERQIGQGPYDALLQTDAPINPGSSGGPLFNQRGELVGISTAMVENGQGIGFAVPSNTALGVLDQLRTRGYVVRGYIGVDIQDITPELAEMFHVPSSIGALVAAVDRGGPAERAGLRVGDVIVAWGGRTIESSARLPRYVSETTPGRKVQVTFLRNGKRRQQQIQVQELETDRDSIKPERESRRSRGIGLSVEPRPSADETGGLTVLDVDPDGQFAASLAPGDVILDVDRSPVKSSAELEARVKPSSRRPLLLRVRRGDTTVFVVVDR